MEKDNTVIENHVSFFNYGFRIRGRGEEEGGKWEVGWRQKFLIKKV